MITLPGRKYIARTGLQTISALQDFISVQAPSDAVVAVTGLRLFQTTDLGDSAEHVDQVEVVRGEGSVTAPSGGSTVTPGKISKGDAAFGGTVRRNDTTRMAAGSGTLVNLDDIGWNLRIPEPGHLWIPESGFLLVSPSDWLAFGLSAAPGDGSISMAAVLFFTEIGG